jgi:type IV pilus assembly protein PilZ
VANGTRIAERATRRIRYTDRAMSVDTTPRAHLSLAGNPVAANRPSVIQLVFREKGALYAAYIPLFAEGGLFVPTTRDYRLGDDIYLLLSLPDDNQRYPVAGKVGWITPANASGGRTQGVGVRFPNDEKTRLLKMRIEEILGTSIQSAKPTQTI